MPAKKLTGKKTTVSATPSSQSNSKTLYIIFGVVVVGLIIIIGWFTYLLLSPTDSEGVTNDNTNKTTVNTNYNLNSGYLNTNDNDNNNNENTNENSNINEDEGLVQPDEEDSDEDTDDEEENENSDDENEDEDNDEDGETVTLYFAPTGSSSCDSVTAVERKMELGDDPYGEIILAMMAGPTSEEASESNVEDAIPSSVRLRQVMYTANGPEILVNEAYEELSECEKATVDAAFIQTANAMFELPASTSGTVVVGEVEESSDEDSNSNSNTNSEE